MLHPDLFHDIITQKKTHFKRSISRPRIPPFPLKLAVSPCQLPRQPDGGETRLQCPGLKEEASVEVSLDLHSLAVYVGFPPRAGHVARLFPGWLGQRYALGKNQDLQQSGTKQALLL